MVNNSLNDNPTWERKQYFGVNSGLYKTTAHGDNYGSIRADIGTIIKTGNGPKIEGAIGFGTDFKMSAKISKDFEIDKNTVINIFGEAEYNKKLAGKPLTSIQTSETTQYTKQDFQEEKDVKESKTENIRDGYKKASAGMIVNLANKKNRIGMGIEAGIRSNLIPNDITIPNKHKINEKFISPILKAEINLNKNDSFIGTADADMYGVNVGLKYIF